MNIIGSIQVREVIERDTANEMRPEAIQIQSSIVEGCKYRNTLRDDLWLIAQNLAPVRIDEVLRAGVAVRRDCGAPTSRTECELWVNVLVSELTTESKSRLLDLTTDDSCHIATELA